jgi:hypothetical protein
MSLPLEGFMLTKFYEIAGFVKSSKLAKVVKITGACTIKHFTAVIVVIS